MLPDAVCCVYGNTDEKYALIYVLISLCGYINERISSAF